MDNETTFHVWMYLPVYVCTVDSHFIAVMSYKDHIIPTLLCIYTYLNLLVCVGYSYGQMYNNPSYSTGGYGQSNYGYGMQGQNYTYSSGIENSMSEQHGGDSYSMQRGYPYGGEKN